jgi:hypothetical protein
MPAYAKHIKKFDGRFVYFGKNDLHAGIGGRVDYAQQDAYSNAVNHLCVRKIHFQRGKTFFESLSAFAFYFLTRKFVEVIVCIHNGSPITGRARAYGIFHKLLIYLSLSRILWGPKGKIHVRFYHNPYPNTTGIFCC